MEDNMSSYEAMCLEASKSRIHEDGVEVDISTSSPQMEIYGVLGTLFHLSYSTSSSNLLYLQYYFLCGTFM